jgi:hypothetical protein
MMQEIYFTFFSFHFISNWILYYLYCIALVNMLPDLIVIFLKVQMC